MARTHVVFALLLSGLLLHCTADTGSDSQDATIARGEDAGRGSLDATSLDALPRDVGGLDVRADVPSGDAGEGSLDSGPADAGGADGSGETAPACGDGVLDPGEACDDGNTVSGDGCEADCSLPAEARGLCAPCTASAQCGGADDRCVAVGSGFACGTACGAGSSCPGGYECRFSLAVESGEGAPQCVPLTDSCEPCDDTDDDTICDAFDACEGFDDLLDADADGQPDDCDPCPADAADDSDGDGVCDSDDVCPEGPDDVDTDTDGLPDACDPCPSDPNPACEPVRFEICNNAIDDDGDGDVDCADADCGDDVSCIGAGVENCTNGIDDDGDGNADCADVDCALDPVCDGGPVDPGDLPFDGMGFETCADPFLVTAFGEYSGPAFSDDDDGSCSSPFVSFEAVIGFVSPISGTVCASTQGSFPSDTVVYVRTSCAAGSEIACVDDTDSSLSADVQWNATAGSLYYVFLEEYENDEFLGEPLFNYSITAGPCL